MFTLVRYFDSADPANRRHCLELAGNSPAGKRGKLYETVRESPADMWPAPVLLGRGYSLTSVAKMARARGLVLDSAHFNLSGGQQ